MICNFGFKPKTLFLCNLNFRKSLGTVYNNTIFLNHLINQKSDELYSRNFCKTNFR